MIIMKKYRYLFLTIISVGLMVLCSCKKEKFIVSFNTLGGSYIESQEINKKDLVNQPNDPIKDGYRCAGWYTTESVTEGNKYNFNDPVINHFVLYAKWEKLEYTIVYHLDGGQMPTSYPTGFLTDEYVELPIPTKEYYRFLGWYENDEKIECITNKNYKLVAKWEQTKCRVDFMKDDDDLFSSIVVEMNETVDLPSVPTKEGHIFKGWVLEGEIFDNQLPINKHLKIYAKWEKVMYTVDFTTYSDSTIESIQVLYGDKIEEPIQPVKEGYDFTGWNRYGIKYDFNQPVTGNVTLAAGWEMKKEVLDNYLSSLIPTVVTTNLNLIESLKFCSATFIWSSSNKKVLTDTGVVKRFTTDTNLKLSVQILYSDKEYSLSFDILVPKLILKPLMKGKIVSGYLYDYGGFSGLSDKALEQLDYINYSFATISNGEVHLSSNMKVEKVLEYRNKGIRIGLAIGGWGSGGFSPAMKTEEGRTKLIDSIMRVIDEYQFDGIDIDWEYPTSSVAGIESDPSDRANLTLFCQELKERMIEYRDDLILSIAITASTKYYDLVALNNYVDIFNVMTYDFAMGTKAQHDSALYTTSVSPSSLDASVSFVSKYVDKDKIIPGAAFYVRKGTFSDGVSQQLGSSLKTSMGSGSMTFANLMNLIENNDQYIEQYDESAKAAYIICNNVFYSYDNVKSIKDKCQYVKENNLGGLMCWELTQDYIDSNGVAILVNAMYESLK